MKAKRVVLFLAVAGMVAVNAFLSVEKAEAQSDAWTCAWSGNYAFCGQYIVMDCDPENCNNTRM